MPLAEIVDARDSRVSESRRSMGAAEVLTNAGGDGLRSYYRAKIEEYEVAVRDKTQNLRRLEAQRNELNHKGASHPPPDPVRSGRSERGSVAPVRGSGGAMHGCPTRRRIPRGGWAPRRRTRASTRRLRARLGLARFNFSPTYTPSSFVFRSEDAEGGDPAAAGARILRG